MTKIHHNTLKKARVHGIVLVADDQGEIVATKDAVRLASGLSGSVVLDAAIAKLGPQEPKKERLSSKAMNAVRKAFTRKPKVVKEDDEGLEDDGEAEGDDDDEGASVVKRVYKTRYRPHKMTCGDDLAQLVAKHLKVEGDDGKPRIDPAKLYHFAVANNCWVAGYKKLNIGMQRMNCVNRLRARVRKGIEIKWV